MTVDEYASFQQANGMKLTRIDGIWWAEVRLFFYRPLFPFVKIEPNSLKYPLSFSVGGYKHVVPSEENSNCRMNFFVFDNLQEYSLDILSDKRRNKIRKGEKHFSLRQLHDAAGFADEGYPIYLSFYRRTRYSYLKDRLKKEYFSKWAKTLFEHPKVLVLGVYQNNELCAASVSYFVEDIIIDATLFSDEESQKYQVSDFILHQIREAAAFTDAKYIFMGMVTGKRTLDDSKLMRGCNLVKMPAYYRLNPVALYFVKAFMKQSYKKINGLT
jgi:hypothetical protein